MKKTMIMAMVAAAATTMTFAAEEAKDVKTFQLTDGPGVFEGAKHVNPTTGPDTAPGTIDVALGYKDGTTAASKIEKGKRWYNGDVKSTTSWNNASALEEVNDFASLSLGEASFGSFYCYGSGDSGSKDTFYITLGDDYQAGDKIVLYAFLGNPTNDLTGVTATGLQNSATTYATGATDSGFTTSVSATAGNAVIVKYEGTLGTDKTLSLQGEQGKTLFSTFSVGRMALTETHVTGASVDVDTMAITLNIADNLANVRDPFNVALDAAIWESIVGGMGETSLDSLATVTLVGADGTRVVLNAATPVTINGSATHGDTGKYMVSFIPEPATATLSLLALAGLAARRRRK